MERGVTKLESGQLEFSAMASFSGAQRAFCVREYYRNNDSATEAQRKFCTQYNIRNKNQAPSTRAIKNWVQKFEETGSTLNQPRSGRPRTSREPVNIERVRASVREQPGLSTRKRSSVLNVSRTSLNRILHKDLHLHPYKIQIVQQLRPSDYTKRLQFANEMLERFTSFNNIFFSDEAHFHLTGHVNRQNCRYWSDVNPQLKHQTPLHSPKVTVWAALSASVIIGPYFFEDQRSRPVTVNTQRYIAMLQNFFAPALQDYSGFNQRTWFQQDGATCHTSNDSIAAVREIFGQKVISKRGDINWPPRSPDLSPMDFFLWGYLKSMVFNNNPQSIEELKENIREEIQNISPNTCRAVMENFRSRLQECQTKQGAHLDDVIFKK